MCIVPIGGKWNAFAAQLKKITAQQLSTARQGACVYACLLSIYKGHSKQATGACEAILSKATCVLYAC